MNFAELRREIRARRRAIVGAQREALSAAATVQALSCPALRRAERVAVFRSLPEEIDTEALLATLHNQGKRLYLPYVTGRGEALAWLPYQPGEALQPDRGRVLAPRWQPEALLPAAELEVVLTPLVAWNRRGYRLGMGGGYYDRSFPPGRTAYLLGLAYGCQEAEFVPQSWDIGLDALATEQQLLTF